MSDSKISVRYSRSLFLLAKEKNIIDTLQKDMELLNDSIRTIEDFQYLLHSPVLKQSDKLRIFTNIFKNQMNDYTIKFFDLLLKNKREAFLKDICRNFIDLCRKEKGLKTASFISALPLSQIQKKEVETLLETSFNSKIELTEKVDPSLIGGFILRVDDQQIDASILKNLSDIKKELLNTIVN